MLTIMLIDTSYPINTRNIKILDSLENTERHVVTWNRDNRAYNPAGKWKEHLYSKQAPYGKLFLKLIKLAGYALFVRRKIKEIKPDYIVASHWETLTIAALFKPENCRLVYENLDMPTSNNKIILVFLRGLEKIALLKSELMICASRFFIVQYRFYKKPIYVLENKPFRNILKGAAIKYTHGGENLKIVFTGNLRYFECMKNLIIAGRDLPVDILFFGDGPDYNNLVAFAADYSNVYFYGKYNYANIGSIYELSDVIWAVYPNRDYNVKYAISNKFFESLVFEKPAFYADKTYLGDFVQENKIGFIVDPYNTDCIRKSIVEILRNKGLLSAITDNIQRYKENNSLFWDDEMDVINKMFSESRRSNV